MKKFGSGDIIYNKIKAYPKVRFFANSGSISYNNNTDTTGNAVLFDFLRTPPPPFVPPEDCLLLAEDGEGIITEDGQELQPEYCDELITTSALLTEASITILSEISEQIIIEDHI